MPSRGGLCSLLMPSDWSGVNTRSSTQKDHGYIITGTGLRSYREGERNNFWEGCEPEAAMG